jgi:branched-chain amino acid transport system substrate-binding protein
MPIQRRLLLLGAATAPVLARPALAQPAREIAIGALYPMSGAGAQVGVDARHALETAVAIVNESHDLDLPLARGTGVNGARLRLVLADHQADPQKGRAEAERLITQERVAALIGSFHSAVTVTASVTAERYGTPFLAADSSSPSLHKRNLKFFFRPAAHDEMFTAAMFDFLDARRKAGDRIETVALVHEDTIFGTDSSAVQRRLAGERGYRVAADVKYRANSPSMTSEVQQLKSADADVLMPSSYTTDAILLLRTMAELGYQPKNILAQAAGFAEQAFYDAVGDRAAGAISRGAFSLDLAARRPSVGAANALFKARSGKDLNDNTSRQLMGMLLMAEAVSRAGSTEGAKIRDALAATDIPGAQTIMPWRRVAYGPDGQNLEADPVLLQWLDGRFQTIFPEQAAIRAARWPMRG